ncbi:MAG: aminopeptidase [Gemmatimonadota bacterium]|nr:MAG: aminopeptidase [Gemmatimonadota bacterium]
MTRSRQPDAGGWRIRGGLAEVAIAGTFVAAVVGPLAAAVALALAVAAPVPAVAEPAAPTAPAVRGVVDELSRDALQGRGLGSPGLDLARDRVRDWMSAAGLAPGAGDAQWLQSFPGPGGEPLANVVGVLKGSGPEWIVIGAHYDGLGLGAPGSEFDGQVHPGADDNASGVAALLRIGAALAAATDLERSIYLVAFSAEESGTLGSRFFVDHPPRDLGQLVAMLNLDTVGGLENEQLIIFGTGTALEFPSVLRGVNHAFRFELALNPEGAGASDHVPFFARGVPVLHFFTGAKAGYHRPGDVPELVNVVGVERIADFVAEVALYLAVEAEPLTFQPTGAERLTRPTSGGSPRRVSFGSIPDFSRDSGGILLSGVMPGGGASAAGLESGDLIVRIDDVEIDNIYDFQGVLAEHDPGDTLVVHYLRGEESRVAHVVLTERK